MIEYLYFVTAVIIFFTIRVYIPAMGAFGTNWQRWVGWITCITLVGIAAPAFAYLMTFNYKVFYNTFYSTLLDRD